MNQKAEEEEKEKLTKKNTEVPKQMQKTKTSNTIHAPPTEHKAHDKVNRELLRKQDARMLAHQAEVINAYLTQRLYNPLTIV